ncbi:MULTISPECIES: helix-turn-helix domain-containing protein [unclassified Methylobacterium]|jgi:putative transcriptional regulator|uniref:helix-turn-helix domain-containing protein n=1 Tax=unclassified Methylobacterium TaxID=2615210 RepID=UPI0013539538|nr:helix-turn-helix domain-containing protein [Methylobacterium sp. 2A]MWV21167.1 helix-turn-helix domain-containing protein [Methylobacterium sp. 2A]
MTAFGEGLVEAAQQALAIARGEADPQTYRVHSPQTNAVKAVRQELGLTQAEFADRFGFAIRTLRDLEQGRVQPDATTQAYLTVIRHESGAVLRALERARAAG